MGTNVIALYLNALDHVTRARIPTAALIGA